MEEQVATDEVAQAGAEKKFFVDMLTKDIELLPAIVDLIDNSVDGANARQVAGRLDGFWVHLQVSPEEFEISDNCGGIEVEVAKTYAFRFGRPEAYKGTAGSVGQFGVGMKRAIFKIGDVFRVESRWRSAEGDAQSFFAVESDVDAWSKTPDWTFPFTELNRSELPDEQLPSGTKITVKGLHSGVAADLSDSEVVGKLRTEIKLRHQEALSKGLEIRLNGTPLTPSFPALQFGEGLAPIHKELEIVVPEGVVHAALYAGTVRATGRIGSARLDPDDPQSFQDPSDAGWYLSCNGRLLLVADKTTLTGWGSPAAAYHPEFRQFRGYVFLTAADASLLPWNTTKTAVDRDSEVFRRVAAEMKTALVAVQGHLNKVKSLRKRLEDEIEDGEDVAAVPALLAAHNQSAESHLADIPEQQTFLAPPPPPTPPRRPPSDPVQRVQYEVDQARYDRAAAILKARSGSEFGRKSFEYFYSREVDE